MGSSDVVILGAGFSYARSHTMPMLNELGKMVLASLGLKDDPRVPNSGFFNEDFTFETWLTLLSENQPHLSAKDNADNAALFLELREAMAGVLAEVEGRVFLESPPAWQRTLTLLLHFSQATVITFNYDRLLEAALANLNVSAHVNGADGPVGIRDALWDQPPVPRANEVWSTTFRPTFRLLKLHGSLDWWIAPLDVSGASLIRNQLTYDESGKPTFSDSERSQFVPGRDVFLIPPTSSKSTYYQNLMTRELWRSSYHALLRATNVALIGYSLPPADLVFMGMLESSLRGKGTYVDIVNPKADEIITRLGKLGLTNLHKLEGEDCVEMFTAKFLARSNENLVRIVANSVITASTPEPVVMTTQIVEDNNLYWRITALHFDVDSHVLTLDARPRGLTIQDAASTEGLYDDAPSPPPTFEAMKFASTNATSIVIRDTNNRVFQPVDLGVAFPPVGWTRPVTNLLTAIEVFS